MSRLYFVFYIMISAFLLGCKEKKVLKVVQENQEAIIQKHAVKCAHKINYYVRMKDYQACLDAGLQKDSTIAYLWQQKGMPYFKIKKYEVGMEYVDKAVLYDRKRYLPYRAFLKCIFSKTYKDAIADFESCINEFGDNYEMDHSYSFYIGLSYLQLEQFEKAQEYFVKAEQKALHDFGELHHTLWFYKGVVAMELQEYQKAIEAYSFAIAEYPQFSDAYYHKVFCMFKLENEYTEEMKELLEKAAIYKSQGYSINEANALYEEYPYQVKEFRYQ